MFGGLKRKSTTTTTTTTTTPSSKKRIKDDDRNGDQDDKDQVVASPEPVTKNKKKKEDATHGEEPKSTSEMIGTTAYKKEMKKKWIDRNDDGRFLVILQERRNAPVLAELDDARQVVQWFRETGFVGVIPEKDDDNNNKTEQLFSVFIVKDFKILILEDTKGKFTSAEEAARHHDKMMTTFGAKYVRNFKRSKRAPGTGGRAEYRFNESAEVTYTVSNSRPKFMRMNIRLMHAMLLRLFHNGQVPESEVWECIRQVMRLVPYWNLGTNISATMLRSFFEALSVAWSIGDSLLSRKVLEMGEDADEDESLEMMRKRQKQYRVLVRERIFWNRRMFAQAKEMYEQTVATKRFSKRPLIYLDEWVVHPLRIEAACLKLIRDEDGLQDFYGKLEELSASPMFTRSASFLLLRGELLISTKEPTKMRDGQQSFAKALELDPSNPRAPIALAMSAHLVAKVQADLLNTTLVSVSQRTTQERYSDDDDDDDDEAAENGAEGDDNNRTKSNEVDAPALIIQAIKNFPDNIANWLALESLLFVEDQDDKDEEEDSQISNNKDEESAKQKKLACLLRLLRMQPTLSGCALARVRLLWRLTTQVNSVKAFTDCFWAVVDVAEFLTQKECPSYSMYFSNVSLEVWEYLVACLARIPEGSIEFESKRAKLWRRRFFPQVIGVDQDPFSFYRETKLTKFRSQSSRTSADTCREDRYFHGLKAVVALKTKVAVYYGEFIANALGEELVKNQIEDRALRACEGRARMYS